MKEIKLSSSLTGVPYAVQELKGNNDLNRLLKIVLGYIQDKKVITTTEIFHQFGYYVRNKFTDDEKMDTPDEILNNILATLVVNKKITLLMNPIQQPPKVYSNSPNNDSALIYGSPSNYIWKRGDALPTVK